MATLLNQETRDQIKEFLGDMQEPLTMVLFTQEGPCETCKETRQLLEEVSALNDKISFVEKDIKQDASEAALYDITLTPSFVFLNAQNEYHGVKFNGIPAGHEINSFLSAILDVSGSKFDISPAVLKRIENIQKEVNIKVFVTLTCPHCPGAVQSAHRLAMLNKHVTGEMIEAQTFYELSQKFNVSGVPKIIINDTLELVGNQPLEAFLDQIESL